MDDLKFYQCNNCGNIVIAVKESGVKIACCGKPMELMIPGSVQASLEAHVPIYRLEGEIVTVSIGATKHPMEDDHYIQWAAVLTNQGYQLKELCPGEPPEVSFALAKGEQLLAVYAFCNKHGLWKRQ